MYRIHLDPISQRLVMNLCIHRCLLSPSVLTNLYFEAGAWFHFLCKNIQIKSKTVNGIDMFEIVKENPAPNVQLLSQESHGWLRSGYFLTISERSRLVSNQGTSTTNSVPQPRPITLICFGETKSLVARFRRFLKTPSWIDILEQPYILMDLVMCELYAQVDQVAWNLNTVFGSLEKVT